MLFVPGKLVKVSWSLCFNQYTQRNGSSLEELLDTLKPLLFYTIRQNVATNNY